MMKKKCHYGYLYNKRIILFSYFVSLQQKRSFLRGGGSLRILKMYKGGIE